MAKKKKKEEAIVINKTELMPTTIGVIDQKETGPLFAFVWVIVFIIGIFLLPYIANLVNGEEIPIFSHKEKEEIKKPVNDTPGNEIKYYEITDSLSIVFEGFQFTKFMKNENIFSFRVVNVSGEESFFIKNNYYIELYNTDKTLLDRFKLENKKIKNFSDFSFDSNNINDISKVALVLKEEKDYPHVSLMTNNDGAYVLECQKNDFHISYLFDFKENEYFLTNITSNILISSSLADYDSLLEEYTKSQQDYADIKGIEAILTPTTSGFTYKVNLNLKLLSTANKNKYFNDSIYYNKDTLAKVISFELESSGYICN